MARKRLGQILIETGAIDDSRLSGALRAQQTFGGKVGEAMVDYGFISDDTLARALAVQLGIPVVTNLVGMRLQVIAKLISHKTALEARALPVAQKGTTLFVAMADPGDRQAIGLLARQTGCTIYPLAAARGEVLEAVRYYFEGVGTQAVEFDDGRTGSSMIVRNDDPEKWSETIYSRG